MYHLHSESRYCVTECTKRGASYVIIANPDTGPTTRYLSVFVIITRTAYIQTVLLWRQCPSSTVSGFHRVLTCLYESEIYHSSTLQHNPLGVDQVSTQNLRHTFPYCEAVITKIFSPKFISPYISVARELRGKSYYSSKFIPSTHAVYHFTWLRSRAQSRRNAAAGFVGIFQT